MMNNGTDRPRIGATELKGWYNRHLAVAFAISVALHGLIIFLFADSEEDTSEVSHPITRLRQLPAPDTTWTEINLVAPETKSTGKEGGGSPEAQEPEGKASKGRPTAVPDKSHNRPDPDKNTIVKNPDKIRPVTTEPKQPNVAGDTRDTSKPTNVAGTRGQDPNGAGDKPAAGSGGVGVGFNVIGSRGWVVKPRASYPSGSSAIGTVTLRFTVLPNGDITNITPVKRADQELVNAAMAGMRRAKARPLPEGVEQAAQTYVIPFTFKLE